MLEVLSRWNRWGSASLDSGIPRRVTERVLTFVDGRETVALVGPRRAGKTTVLFQIMDALVGRDVPAQGMLHVNLEEPALGSRLGTDLLEQVYRIYREEVFPEGKAYLFLDEVQAVPEWERWVVSRTQTDNIKVFVSGSSSRLLSREFGTLLTGRHVEIPVWPLDFAEFLRFRGISLPRSGRLAGTPPTMQKAVSEYLAWGGFPEVVLADDDVRKEALLKQYFEDVLFKDVAMRHEIRDLVTLRAMAVHLLSSTASLASYQRLARVFGISLDRARDYSEHLREAFLVDFLTYFSLKAAERRRHPHKVHAVDAGLRNAVCLTGSRDRGRLAETAVFGALLRSGVGELYYWKARGEIDVLVRSARRTEALIQVCADPESAMEREVASLEQAAKKFRAAKRILVVGRHLDQDLAGVEVVPLWRFLLEPTVGDRP